MLTELIGTLDTRKTTTGKNIIPKKEDRYAQLKETYETLMGNMRFYNTYAASYLGCMILNLVALLTQAYWIVSFIGNGDFNFAFNVLDNFQTEYKKWPVKMLYDFPSVAICTYEKIGYSGTRESRDFFCALTWNISFLKFFAVLWFLEIFCILVTAVSLIYLVLFLTAKNFRESIVRQTLKVPFDSFAYKGVQRLNGGTLFIIILLNNNVKTEIVCKILRRVSRETMQNFQNYEIGL